MTIEERRTHWRTIIDNQAASGMTITAYCREARITPSYFHKWRRRLKEQQSSAGSFLELIPGKRVDVVSGVRICLSAKLAVEVTRGFDPFTLRAVVETLGGFSPC
ncbi:MAG: hypothetical protein C0394_12060 [Syntrophus sp. (in: bacteria)]|nr:hypothetical protein [Syntrophus sp. (in: bacteria)]